MVTVLLDAINSTRGMSWFAPAGDHEHTARSATLSVLSPPQPQILPVMGAHYREETGLPLEPMDIDGIFSSSQPMEIVSDSALHVMPLPSPIPEPPTSGLPPIPIAVPSLPSLVVPESHAVLAGPTPTRFRNEPLLPTKPKGAPRLTLRARTLCNALGDPMEWAAV